MGISQLEIFGNSKLIVNQILEQYDVKKEDLIPYCKYAKKLLFSWLKKKKSKPTSFLYALLKKKIGNKRSLNTFNMEDSQMINTWQFVEKGGIQDKVRLV